MENGGTNTTSSRGQTAVTVTQLTYADVIRAARTFQATFAQDPVIRYVRNEREQSRIEKITERLLISTYLVFWIRTRVALTVKSGTANIIAAPPKATTGRRNREDGITKIAEWLMRALIKGRKRTMRDPEAKRRRKEVDQKLQAAVKRVLGDRVDKMWLVEELWTVPARQGKGYGGALLDAVMVLADWAGQSTWLQSSNIANTAFYNSHGFETVETVLLGDQNPTWHRKPVVVSIMVREPRWPLSAKWSSVEAFCDAGGHGQIYMTREEVS